MMPKCDPRDRFVYPYLTRMMDSYIPRQPMQMRTTNTIKISVWEQLATVKNDPEMLILDWYFLPISLILVTSVLVVLYCASCFMSE